MSVIHRSGIPTETRARFMRCVTGMKICLSIFIVGLALAGCASNETISADTWWAAHGDSTRSAGPDGIPQEVLDDPLEGSILHFRACVEGGSAAVLLKAYDCDTSDVTRLESTIFVVAESSEPWGCARHWERFRIAVRERGLDWSRFEHFKADIEARAPRAVRRLCERHASTR